ncbi:hypothetical protein [Paenibacillus sp. FSL L8-0494]|uniref:hypothetical protein n=1 Tax=Paenibacillus sp. FSL L8-0494 TaxID=2975352 RepID=UPI0030F76CF8
MIRVKGTAKVRCDYEVVLPMTEEEFDRLSEKKQNELLDTSIDWKDALRSGWMDEIEIDYLAEV